MSGKVFDLTPETEGPRRPVRRSASWEYGSSAGEIYVARKRALERAADDALLGAQWVVRRREARGQTGGEDAVTLALTRPPRGYGGPEWEQEVRRAVALQAEGTAYLARKREERLRRKAAEGAEGAEGGALPAASMSEASMVQARAEVGREGGALSPALSGRIQARRGGGQPLEATVRQGLEGVFGVDFSPVRIHADAEADALNRGVAAIAFTVGSDIFFRAGAYQPQTPAGQHLLAHELTHVVQQRAGSLGTSGGGGASGGTMTVGAVDDRHEQEAEQTAHRVTVALQQQALQAHATMPGAGIARHYDPDVALAPTGIGVARVAAPAPRSPATPALFGPTPPGARCLPPRRPPFAFVLTTGGANLHPTEPQAAHDLASPLGLLPVTTKVEVLTADPAHDWARVCVLAGPGPAAGLVGRVGWVRYSWLDAQWPAGDPDATMYVIQPGDTALGLAARFYGLAGSDHPETNADLRRYVEVLVRVNQHGSYWIEHGNDGDPLTWMRAQVRATYAMWVPSRAWAGKAAGAAPNPSLTGGAWAAVHQQLQAQGWGGVNILQAVSLFAQDVAVVGDRAVGALRHAIVVSGTLLGAVTAETARAVLPVLQDLASAAVAPAVLMAKLGALAAKKLADVPAALLALLERKARDLLAGLFGDPLLHQLGGAVQAILRDPKAFIVNLGNALSKGVGGLLTHLSHPKNFIDDVLQWVATQLGITSLPPLPWTWTTLIPVAQEILQLTEDNLTRLLAAALRQHGDRNPEGTIARARAAAGGLHTLLTEGIGGVWAQALAAKQTAAGLAQQVFDGVKQWVLGQLVQGAVGALVRLGVPGAGPFLEAAQGIYAAFQTFLSYKDTLAGLLGQLLPTLSGLATGTAGAVEATGAAITKVLVGLIQPALDFLARFLGLGGLATRIKTVLHGIQARIDGLIAKLVDRLAGVVKSLAAGHGRGSSPAPGHTPVSGHGDPAHDARVHAGVQELVTLDQPYAKEGIKKVQAEAIAARVHKEHPVFKSISVVDGGDTWNYEYVASTGYVKGDKQRELEEDLAKAHAAFGTTLFSRHDLGLCLRVSESTATRRINQWKGRAEGESGKLYTLASSLSDAGTLYSFDKGKAGQREVSPGNRNKYGFKNPDKSSSVGLQILSKGLRPDSPPPIEKTSATYHKTKARYDSMRPGSTYKDFPYDPARLGHKEGMGASQHWNRIGHKQTKVQNQAWNNDPANYQGPEHRDESDASGGASDRYIVPNRDIGSNPEWL